MIKRFLLITYTFFLSNLIFQSCTTEPYTNRSRTSPIQEQPGMVFIPAGTLHMGGDNRQADRNEFPKHEVVIDAFWMDQTEVTNAEFAKFVKATAYQTVAERSIIWEEIAKTLPLNTPKPPDSLLQPGALVFQKTVQPVRLDDPRLWWHWTLGANWRHPEGPNSDLKGKERHPVVQIAWEDAMAYCRWVGKRLPTEAEWEWAARGGKADNIYPWGNESVSSGVAKANYWQGLFPYQNTAKDGHLTTAPVKSYPPNGYELYDMPGNVWEWCSDWFDMDYYQRKEASRKNNIGPEKLYYQNMPYPQEKVVRGGSFLCNDDYCSGYRNSRRMGSTPDTGLNHTGFRCVKDME